VVASRVRLLVLLELIETELPNDLSHRPDSKLEAFFDLIDADIGVDS
jgi:hypothetical protein